MEKKTNGLSWPCRIIIYGITFVVGLVAAHLCMTFIDDLLWNQYGVETNFFTINPSIPLAIFLFGFVLSIGTWYIRTSDTIKQFKDSLQVRNDTLFIEAVRLIFEGEEVQSRAQGLLQIVGLERNGAIDREQLNQITMSQINLEKAYLEGANLTGTHLEGAHLRGANLKGANLKGAHLSGADLRDTNLRDTNLKGANFMHAQFTNTSVGGDFNENLNRIFANFENAKYNKYTRYPAYFSPTDAKMVKSTE